MKLAHTAVAGITTALLVSIAVTGCSGGGGGGNTPPPNNGGNGSGNTPNSAKIYTNDDLVKILTMANTSMSAGGTVDNEGTVGPSAKDGESMYERVISEGGTFTPAACGQLFDKLDTDAATLGGVTGSYAAKLEYGSSLLSASSSASPVDVATLSSLLSGDLTALTQQCASAQILTKSVNAAFSFSTATATTDADTTYAYTEKLLINGVPLTSVAVVGIYGNILFFYEGLKNSTVQDGVTAINAGVTAAKSI